MTDLHSHILPELDDGARDLEEAVAMARLAVDSGVQVMAVTPHCDHDRSVQVLRMLELTSRALEENGIGLKLCPGMEIYGTRDTARWLREGKLLTLNGSRYPLIEFDFTSDGDSETETLERILDGGYRPVVAHPERYRFVQSDPELLNRWHSMGCLMQVNKGSLLGRFGENTRLLALALVDRGFAALVASDAHRATRRTPWMREVHRLLEEVFSPEAAEVLLQRNPDRIIRDLELSQWEPVWF